MSLAGARPWIRKVHNFLGLYLLLFLWLFSVSGLLLNHPRWSPHRFWEARRETVSERAIQVPAVGGDGEIATALVSQLGIVGEIAETRRHPDEDRFDVQIVRPGRVVRVEARLAARTAKVTDIRLNTWGVMDALHKFTGVRMDDPTRTRDWWLTRIWSVVMDALAIGLVVLVLSGVLLWCQLTDKRRAGLVALTAGLFCCAFLLYGMHLVS